MKPPVLVLFAALMAASPAFAAEGVETGAVLLKNLEQPAGGVGGLVGGFFNALTFKLEGDAQLLGAPLNELAHAVLHACGNHKVFSFSLLQHHPLHAHIVFRVSPITQSIQITHVQALL